ncbi:hypothetical protein GBA52_010226 [Prunus armeniaca]|nr:hypothetical protein GBA52_010226 [Prunus armeniaca]
MQNRIRDQFIQFHLDAQEVRSSKNLKSRWTNISQMCNKFSECLTQVARLNKSGQNENDNIIDAKRLLFREYQESIP